MVSFWLANGIGFLTLPLALWQFGLSRSRSQFLWLNLLSSLCWAAGLGLTGQETAALVSLTAGVASAGQALILRFSSGVWGRRALQAAGVLLAITVVFWLTPPAAFWSWFPLGAFLYARVIETFPQILLRWLVPASPLAWIAIAAHAGVYGLMPADLVAFGGAVFWLWNRYQKNLIP